MLRLATLFSAELRGFLQMAPEYIKPMRHDVRRLEALIGAPALTPYERVSGATLDWLAA